MSKRLYLRLALQNIRNNHRTYIPYILSGMCTIMMFYVMNSLNANRDLAKIPHSTNLRSLLGIGVVIIAIFAAIFLFYTNSFLMKRRKKELGLYNILGMEKRHIARVLLWESLLIFTTSFLGGILVGIIVSKLIFLLVLQILHFPVQLGFFISGEAILNGAKLFALIYLATYLYNLHQIQISNPIQLLQGGNVGEREPKSKWLLAILGILTLGIGYYLAITTKSPLEAIWIFFVATILVMVGTYLLFTTVSIVFLKMLRKNKKYYYQTKHFTSVSGMLYRMKQNAVGLANICILSTGVLLMISATVSLYVGREDMLLDRFPQEITIQGSELNKISSERAEGLQQQVDSLLEETLEEYHLTRNQGVTYRYATMMVTGETDGYEKAKNTSSDVKGIVFLPLEDYQKATGDRVTLEPKEVLIYSNLKKGFNEDVLRVDDKTWKVKQELQEMFVESKKSNPLIESLYVVVDTYETVEAMVGADEDMTMNSFWGFDLQGDSTKYLDFENTLEKRIWEIPENEYLYAYGRASNQDNFYITFGSFFFLGIFLGLLFLMATAMIIYYKQVSEGIDDRERFAIMGKIGMSKKEVRSTIRSQVITVFFLPLVMAAIHIVMAFPLITRLLAMFYLTNVELFALCTAGTVAVFALVYGAIYGLTARTYYKIVN